MLYHLTHLFARTLSEQTLLAYYRCDARDYHVKSARDSFLKLLSGQINTSAEARSEVLDLIENAIVDAIDMDTTPAIQAEAVLNALLDSAVPMPKGEK